MGEDYRKQMVNQFFSKAAPDAHPSILEAIEMLVEIAKKARCPICDGTIVGADTNQIRFSCGHYLGKW